MSRFVVLLRGVNVGKGNKVPMAQFRAALEDLGYDDVRTLLNSGNAVFSSTSRSAGMLASSVARVVGERFGVATPVIVKSARDFKTIVEDAPLAPPESDRTRFVVAFAMDARALRELDSLVSLVEPGERFAVTRRAAYLHCPGGLLKSRVGKALLGRAGRNVTTRNWATVLKLSSLAGGSAA